MSFSPPDIRAMLALHEDVISVRRHQMPLICRLLFMRGKERCGAIAPPPPMRAERVSPAQQARATT